MDLAGLANGLIAAIAMAAGGRSLSEQATVRKRYQLAWGPYLKDLGYVILAELAVLWLGLLISGGGSGLATAARFLTRFWWLWLGGSISLGLLVFKFIEVTLDQKRLATLIFGRSWRILPWEGVRQGRVLRVGATVAVLAQTERGQWGYWRQGGLARADDLAQDLRRLLGRACQRGLTAPYVDRQGAVWSVGAEEIKLDKTGRQLNLTPANLAEVKFVFVEGEDLPLRTYLFVAGESRPERLGPQIRFYPFLAADILRFARSHGIKVESMDLGKNRPRMFSRGQSANERPLGSRRQSRPWDEQGFW